MVTQLTKRIDGVGYMPAKLAKDIAVDDIIVYRRRAVLVKSARLGDKRMFVTGVLADNSTVTFCKRHATVVAYLST